jgi:hypothetical protein
MRKAGRQEKVNSVVAIILATDETQIEHGYKAEWKK